MKSEARPKKHFLRNEQGSVLIQVLIAAGLALSVVLVLAQMIVMMNKMVSQTQLKLSLFELRNNILSTIVSEVAWKNTINHADNTADPKAKACLQGINGDTPPPYDCSGLKAPLTVVDGSNAVMLKAGLLTSGFTSRGTACNAFNATAGNSACPIHIEAQWETECVSPCNMKAPPLKVSVSFQYMDPNAPFSINTKQLNFVLRR